MLGAGCVRDLGQLVGHAEHRQPAVRDAVGGRRVGVEEADRAQAVLGLLLEPAARPAAPTSPAPTISVGLPTQPARARLALR